MFEALSGYKTYITVALAGIVLGAQKLGWIDESTRNMVWGVLGFGGLAALRAGVKQVAADAYQKVAEVVADKTGGRVELPKDIVLDGKPFVSPKSAGGPALDR